MKKTKLLKTGIILMVVISMAVYACSDSETKNNPAPANEVTMKFNGADWNTMITTGSQTANSISVGSFNDAGVSVESFFLQFKKGMVAQGNTYDATVLENYQIQHLGTNYTIMSASFTVSVLTSTRFEATYSMTLSGGATITGGTIKINI